MMTRAKKRKLAQAKGRCYEEAGAVVAFKREGLLVHGTIWSGFFRRYIAHAWVELPPGTHLEDGWGDEETLREWAVLDLTLKKKQRLLPKDVYYALAKPERCRSYTPEEVSAQIARAKHWGPWTEEVTTCRIRR